MTRPVVTTDPSVRFGRPHIRGRSPVFLAGTHWVGDDACDEYDVTRPELLIACWWLGWYGPKKWRRRWKAWADQWHEALAREEYDAVPDAPRKDER